MTLRSAAFAIALLGVTDGLVLAAMQALMAPPAKDLLDLGLFLLGSGSFALLVVHLVSALSRRGAIRSLPAQVLLLPVVVVTLTVLNVGFIGRLMFVSAHDLALLTVLLMFSLAMSVVCAFILSGSIRGGIAGLLTRQQELEQARREMVVAISHDLRTPLSSMRAMAESINDGVVKDPETVGRYLRTMESEVTRLSLLIDDLFELSQIDAAVLELHLERASLRDLVSDTLESMTPQARQRGLVLEGHVEESLPEVVMDSRRMQRVLINLVQNAIRHTPADGTVSIEAQADAGEVRVEVRDTGEGIPPEDLPRVFEPFFQGDRARSKPGGSGVGLSIVKALVEAHGGRVWASSTAGKGSTFTFTVPAAQ